MGLIHSGFHQNALGPGWGSGFCILNMLLRAVDVLGLWTTLGKQGSTTPPLSFWATRELLRCYLPAQVQSQAKEQMPKWTAVSKTVLMIPESIRTV